MSDQPRRDESTDSQNSSSPTASRPSSAEASEPSSPTVSEPSSAEAADPEDWQSTAVSGDDERYLRERPPHWG